jgi:pyruvate,water dikinase
VLPLPLDHIAADDLPHVGGKALNCARLRQAGFPVPDGLVIPSEATDAEIPELATHAWLDTVSPDARFAVRSSGIGEDTAGHSFAGIHETKLNVERIALVDAVLACRRSADSAAARAYRETRRVAGESAAIGVLVQVMVPAQTSGVAFTINPITGADELVINAGRGLGEALVSGQIDPDEFRVSKGDRWVLSARPGASSVGTFGVLALSAAELDELAELLTRIDRHYGAPQDIEWCIEAGVLYVVDGSEPLLEIHAAEMEILRLLRTGRHTASQKHGVPTSTELVCLAIESGVG